MANIFDKFDSQVDIKKIEEQKAAAAENSFEDVPAGMYIAKIESMEIGLTKKDERPMFKLQMRLVDGDGADEKSFLAKYKKKKPCVFMNKVIFGTKNDGAMISGVETFLAKIFPDDPVVFVSYSQFAEEVLDAAEDCEGLLFAIDYDPERFNSITIEEVFDA